jgi:cobyrinic acid a,c-diamide synthase
LEAEIPATPVSIPRLAIAGTSGGSGKTILSLGLARALKDKGLAVKPFKKGPDYIDAVWLGLAAGRPAVNLDQFILGDEIARALFHEASAGMDIALVEGNRGLFDGLDEHGSTSTAELARLIDLPVILSLDCTKMTRTAAALLQGLSSFEPGLRLAGVVLSRVAGERHSSVLVRSVELHTDVPVLGVLPKLTPDPIPERHMGLISDREYSRGEAVLKRLAKLVRENCDLDSIQSISESIMETQRGVPSVWPAPEQRTGVVIGVVRDAALWFYYEENIEALRRAGADVVELSILDGATWPEIHGLYLGGGFPETMAEGLAENASIRAHVRKLAESGLPIYAECGGFMYLGEKLVYRDREYPMAGVLEVATTLSERPMGLGYVEAEVVGLNSFHPMGASFRGHEFHYSCCAPEPAPDEHCLTLSRGQGMGGGRDGILKHNTFASYTHIHALACPWWAPNFVAEAGAYRLNS